MSQKEDLCVIIWPISLATLLDFTTPEELHAQVLNKTGFSRIIQGRSCLKKKELYNEWMGLLGALKGKEITLQIE